MPMDELTATFDGASRYFALLAEPIRVRILHAICNGERSVGDIVTQIGASQPSVSRHLGLMHRAGVLSRRREGGLVYYGVADPVLTELCRVVCVHVAGRETAPRPGVLDRGQAAAAWERGAAG